MKLSCDYCGMVHDGDYESCDPQEYNHEHERHRARHQRQDKQWADARNKKSRRKFQEQQERELL